MEEIIIVDSADTIIGSVPRDKRTPTDYIRVSALWVTDSKGNILLARRAESKETDPGKWGPAVAGTNEHGETYIDNIKKETAEEIGVKLTSFTTGKKVLYEGDFGPSFVQWFVTVFNKNTSLKPQKSEVAELGWFSKEDLAMLLQEMPDMFIGNAPGSWPELFL